MAALHAHEVLPGGIRRYAGSAEQPGCWLATQSQAVRRWLQPVTRLLRPAWPNGAQVRRKRRTAGLPRWISLGQTISLLAAEPSLARCKYADSLFYLANSHQRQPRPVQAQSNRPAAVNLFSLPHI